MKKFMIVQLGLILALASSNALAAAKPGERVGGADKADVLGGKKVHDEKLDAAARQAGEAQAGGRQAIKDALNEDGVVSSKVAMPAKGSRTQMQQAEAANVKILKLAEGNSLGKHSARVIEILSKSRANELEKLQLIADEIGKTKEQLLAKCEE